MSLNYPRIAVRALLLDQDDKVLLLKRSNTHYGMNKWCLPGGKVEVGETVKQTVIKEIKEETNLDCNFVSFLFYLDNLPDGKEDMHYISLFFECKFTGKVELNSESSEFVWAGRGDLANYQIAFRNDEALQRYWGMG